MLQGKRFFPHKTATKKIKNLGILRRKAEPFGDAPGSFLGTKIDDFGPKSKPHILKVLGKPRNFGKRAGRFGGCHELASALFAIKHPFVYERADGLSGGHTAYMEFLTKLPFRRNKISRLVYSIVHKGQDFFLELIIKRQRALTLKLFHHAILSCLAVVIWYIPHDNRIPPAFLKVKKKAPLNKRSPFRERYGLDLRNIETPAVSPPIPGKEQLFWKASSGKAHRR